MDNKILYTAKFTHQIMILSSTKFGGNRTKDVEVGPDRWTDRQTDRQTFLYTPPNYYYYYYHYKAFL
jgi:hypothetical protein